MDVQTRPATSDDESFARLTHHAAYRSVVELQFGVWNQARQDEFFDADWQVDRMEIIVAHTIACGYWSVEECADDLPICELVIHPDWQGRGIGGALIRGIQTRAAERDVPVRLGTLHLNRARHLYERLGFRAIDRTDTHVLMEWWPTRGARHDSRIRP